jgi:hypothetical protein
MEQHSSAAAARHFEARREAAAAIWSSGNLLAHNRLPPLQDATTVRARDARVSATDGPYA